MPKHCEDLCQKGVNPSEFDNDNFVTNVCGNCEFSPKR